MVQSSASFRTPINCKWDGKNLSFIVNAKPGSEFDRCDTHSLFEGSLTQEKQSEKVQWTLTGLRQSWRCYEILGRVKWSATRNSP